MQPGHGDHKADVKHIIQAAISRTVDVLVNKGSITGT
jgi:hypothetical protein